MAVPLDASRISIPNVANNISYLNVAADGSGFASFIIGEASAANITQWNSNLGLMISLTKEKKRRTNNKYLSANLSYPGIINYLHSCSIFFPAQASHCDFFLKILLYSLP